MSPPGTWRVLIADDHTPTREDVRDALAADDRFRVCAVVADAAAAVQAALGKRPDVCVLDIRMPGNGVAAAWEICARLPEAKVVMLTVSDSEDDLFSALRAGADGYLVKTMDFGQLGDALAGVCQGEAAIQRTLVTRMVKRFHGREPRWRSPAAGETQPQRLTSREWEVLDLLAQGCSTAEIARALVLSASAVRVHIAAIVRKLNVRDRASAVDLFRARNGAAALRGAGRSGT